MTNANSFQPLWASPPGETIYEILRRRRIDVASFASDFGESEDYVQCLLHGDCAIDRAVAERLHDLVGGSISFWLNREAQYREDIARIQATNEVESVTSWLKELPLRDMRNFGWISPSADKLKQAKECLRFFGVSDIKEWRATANMVQGVVAFRTSEKFKSSPGAVAAWLRQGELDAAKITCKPWDREKFRAALQSIRKLTRIKDPEQFLPELEKICADCGVAFVVLRAPQGCRASGATKFVVKDKAMLLLSVRYKSDDHFWFTFFHEAGHLVLHDCAALFIEGENLLSTDEEREADEFSEQLLVPAQFQEEMLRLPLNRWTIARFAKKVGISPGIVVGQLQHAGVFPRDKMNRLKKRFDWA
jgi:Zn-dependent peptidase ImmA (M78 family)/plasmid maintenance system antidote protein VapI